MASVSSPNFTHLLEANRPYALQPKIYNQSQLDRGELNSKWVTWTRGTAVSTLLSIQDEKLKTAALAALGSETFVKSAALENSEGKGLSFGVSPFNTQLFKEFVDAKVNEFERSINQGEDSFMASHYFVGLVGIATLSLNESKEPQNSLKVVKKLEGRFVDENLQEFQSATDLNKLFKALTFLNLSNHEHPKFTVKNSSHCVLL